MATNKKSGEDIALERFTEMMIKKIETIQDDWKKPWFCEGVVGWPTNLAGRNYNGTNAFMLSMLCEERGFKIPVFATFNNWSDLNFASDKKTRLTKDGVELPFVKVLKDEKMFPVTYTSFSVFHKKTDEKISYDEYIKLTREEQMEYNVFPRQHVYYVLNVDQTNLKEARPELYAELEKKYITKPARTEEGMFVLPEMDDLIEKQNWVCPIKLQYGDDCYYSVSRDEIVVPLKKQFKDGESFYGNAFHEMAHSTGHKDRRNRLVLGTGFGSKEYAREELVAEMTAALVGVKFGIQKNIKEDSCAYLKNWLASLKEEPSFLKTVLSDVKKASNDIIERLKTIE